jgi:hypothetical protein
MEPTYRSIFFISSLRSLASLKDAMQSQGTDLPKEVSSYVKKILGFRDCGVYN